MPSPDATPYVDLTLLDVTADELAAHATEQLAARLPGWVPNEASPEVMLIEAVAVITQELVYAVNRLPGAVLETLLRLYGLDRSLGTYAVATVELTAPDTLGHEIPAGTRLRLDVDDAVEAVIFELDDTAVITAGNSTLGAVAVTATTATADPNGVTAGTALTIIDPVPLIAATIETAPAGGAGPEDGTTFLDRAAAKLATLSSTLVLPEHFTAAALENAAVYRATTIDLYDAVTPAAGQTGHVTVAVRGPAGTALDAGELAALDAELEAAALASLQVHTINATVTAVTLEAVFTVVDGYTPADVEAEVDTALRTYLSPDTWEWGDKVRRNELIAVVSNVAGVDYVTHIYSTGTTELTDITLTGPANLVTPGTITVTAA